MEYNGALQSFFRNSLSRDALVAFLGPEKRGKSWWLQDVAYRALLQRRRVAMFEVGDMSRKQWLSRMAIRATRKPFTPRKVNYPTGITLNDDGKHATPSYEVKSFEDAMTLGQAQAAASAIMQRKVKSEESHFRLSVHPNGTLSVAGLRGIIEGWARDGWMPDVVVIDYADILAPPEGAGKMDVRHQINETWKELRALSQQLHCLVVTATQANAASYDTYVVTRRNFSEDKRKLAHVTGMIGLNMQGPDFVNKVIRLNWVALREDEYDEHQCWHCATCLPLANPAVVSCDSKKKQEK